MMMDEKERIDFLLRYVQLLITAQCNGQKVTKELDEAIKKIHCYIVAY